MIGQWTQTQLWKIIGQPDYIASEWPQAKKDDNQQVYEYQRQVDLKVKVISFHYSWI